MLNVGRSSLIIQSGSLIWAAILIHDKAFHQL